MSDPLSTRKHRPLLQSATFLSHVKKTGLWTGGILVVGLFLLIFISPLISPEFEQAVQEGVTTIIIALIALGCILWVAFNFLSMLILYVRQLIRRIHEFHEAPLGGKIIGVLFFFAAFAWWWYGSLEDGLQLAQDFKGLIGPLLFFIVFFWLRDTVWYMAETLIVAPFFLRPFLYFFPNYAPGTKAIQRWQKNVTAMHEAYPPTRVLDKIRRRMNLPPLKKGRLIGIMFLSFIWSLAGTVEIFKLKMEDPAFQDFTKQELHNDPIAIALILPLAFLLFWFASMCACLMIYTTFFGWKHLTWHPVKRKLENKKRNDKKKKAR